MDTGLDLGTNLQAFLGPLLDVTEQSASFSEQSGEPERAHVPPVDQSILQTKIQQASGDLMTLSVAILELCLDQLDSNTPGLQAEVVKLGNLLQGTTWSVAPLQGWRAKTQESCRRHDS